MAITTFNWKQKHEIITKCMTLWAQIEMKKKKSMQIVNISVQSAAYLLPIQMPNSPPCPQQAFR